jgi:homoserine dehydrogenase
MGNVGCGTVKVLTENQDRILQLTGSRVVVKRIAVAHLTKKRPEWVDRSMLTDDPAQVLDDPEIDIVAETIGGLQPAKEFMLHAIRNGKSVVTANKELLAKEGHELLISAARKPVDFLFEGAVAGGIPIIRPLKIDLAGNRINSIIGIVNGTTNYILTKMAREGSDFAETLAEAQKLGYAEVDPTDDVEGYDAAYKLAILSAIAFQSRVPISGVFHEGIRRIGKVDIEYAKGLGYTIKLLAIAKLHGDAMELRVHPAMVHDRHPLASVNDVYNAVFLHGDAVGDVMFYGRGAGMMPTGSAVAGDIIDICRNINHQSLGRISCTCFEDHRLIPIGEVVSKYYVRMQVIDRPKVLSNTARVFGEHNVSIASVVQRETTQGDAEIVWVTHPAREMDVRAALEEMTRLEVVHSISNLIRVED